MGFKQTWKNGHEQKSSNSGKKKNKTRWLALQLQYIFNSVNNKEIVREKKRQT